MDQLFNLQNWHDLIEDSGFWSAALILLLVGAAVGAALYSQNIQRWRSERQERIKWTHWNR